MNILAKVLAIFVCCIISCFVYAVIYFALKGIGADPSPHFFAGMATASFMSDTISILRGRWS